MRDLELGRAVRAVRRRRRWRQEDAARRADVHRSTWSNLERGRIQVMSLATLRQCLAAVEIRLRLVPSWRGSGLDRLLDEQHAGIAAAWKRRLERWGWQVHAEVSYSRYGERGRVDLLAWHPVRRIVLVVEVKSEIVDVQELLGTLDAKTRLAPFLAREQGRSRVLQVVPALVVADEATNRRRIARHATLFSRFVMQGRSAISWLRHPDSSPEGLLIFSVLSAANGSRGRRLGAERVRRTRGELSSSTAPRSPNPRRGSS